MKKNSNTTSTSSGLYIIMLSVHGLLRHDSLELGRDPDTGGQIKYVLELAQALSQRDEVRKVELITRSVEGKNIDPTYKEPETVLNDKASIVRLQVGPRRYLKKENLWPYVSEFSDAVLSHIRSVGERPDIIHGHYADAGIIGGQVSRLLGVPFIFTGHSLGRVKKDRLIKKGSEESSLNHRFKFTNRIEAEEFTLETASVVIASTKQEVEEQYELYDHYRPELMRVIPPGIDLGKYQNIDSSKVFDSQIYKTISRFLKDPRKPSVLAIARPDAKKNFPALIEAFGSSPTLRENANLILVAGIRTEVAKLSAASRRVFRQIFALIDEHDLYGSVALPKEHAPEDIAILYALARLTRGVFVNPALNEPFGLTIIEAAASGVPIVATKEGGPAEILAKCENGILVKPTSSDEISSAITKIVGDPKLWDEYSEHGMTKSVENYSWFTHVDSYLSEVADIRNRFKDTPNVISAYHTPLASFDRILMVNLDHVLEGSRDEMAKFKEIVIGCDKKLCFGVSTGRSIKSALNKINDLDMPTPAIIISGAGSVIHYGKVLVEDYLWRTHIAHRWRRERLLDALSKVPELKLQEQVEITEFKISYTCLLDTTLTKTALSKYLRQIGLRVNIVWSFDNKIDIIPIRASTGMALRHLGLRWGVDPDKILVAGFAANDIPMLKGSTLGVVVGGFREPLEKLKGSNRVYFSDKSGLAGLLDGIGHYDFFGAVKIPLEQERLISNE